jgi:hypothetical protein
MVSRTHRWLVSGIAVVAAMAGGWWQWHADEGQPSRRDRIAALDGVSSVEYEPVHPYEVTLEPGIDVDRIGDVLTDASSILSSTDDTEAYPMMWVKIGSGEVFVDLTADAETTATIVDTTASAVLAGFEVQLTGDAFSQFAFERRSEVVPHARELLSDLDEAGIDDLGSMGSLEFLYVESHQHGPLLELDPSRPDVAVDRIDTLTRCLRRSGADLVDAELGDGDQVIEVAVPRARQVDPTADVFTDAYGARHLELTISRGIVTRHGLVVPPERADQR